MAEKSYDKFKCKVCGWIYDPDKGYPEQNVAKNTPFEDLPDDWTCPNCGVGKDEFERDAVNTMFLARDLENVLESSEQF